MIWRGQIMLIYHLCKLQWKLFPFNNMDLKMSSAIYLTICLNLYMLKLLGRFPPWTLLIASLCVHDNNITRMSTSVNKWFRSEWRNTCILLMVQPFIFVWPCLDLLIKTLHGCTYGSHLVVNSIDCLALINFASILQGQQHEYYRATETTLSI